MRRHLHFSALLTPLALAACLEPEPIPQTNIGFIPLRTVVSTNDTILSPEAFFFRTDPQGLPTSRVLTDQCLVTAYPTPTLGGGLPRFLDAGDSVAVSTAADTMYLFPTIGLDGESYVPRQTDQFPFHPGESVTITVPGTPGGFASGTISVTTVRGFAFGPIEPQPPAGEPLELTWSPAGDDDTMIRLWLQYGVGRLEPNEQIFCSLVDDGAAEVPSLHLTDWRTAMTGSRRYEAERWRIARKEVTGGVLLALSVFEIEGVVD
jgi:hypothetical protein